ncbi:MAG: DUF4198 domain-containing protein [Desulfobacterales bacterium]
MKVKHGLVLLCSVLCLMAFCPPVLAHNLWLNPANYYPEVGSTVDIGIGWGHKYPAGRVDQEVTEDRVAEIIAVDPEGVTVNLAKVSAALYQLKVEKAGAYLITARTKSGFFTMTPEGRKWGDKKSIPNAVKCTNFHLVAKTAIIAGNDAKNLSHPAGQPLEVIPLTPLQDLKAGSKLGVKVLFEGKELADMDVKATYAGFETEDVAPHGSPKKDHAEKGQPEKGHTHGHAKHFPAETVTGDQGQAEISLEKAGYWMIVLSHKPPYPDKEICDESMYNTSFTFEVR